MLTGKKLSLLLLLAICTMTLAAQPRYDLQRLQRERLGRGVVAVKVDGGVAVSWRLLETDTLGQAFDIYRNGLKLNALPLCDGGTFFLDSLAQNLSDTLCYTVRGGGIDGSFTLPADAPQGYVSIPIAKPGPQYAANDASVGDVDGDGEYEIILKWEPRNAHDNSHAGITDNTFIDCYRIPAHQSASPQPLWRIDLGPNIRSGAHYTPFLVYDFDGDGRAELMVRTADGSRDGEGRVIGDERKDWRCRDEGRRYGHVLYGPDYLTVFDGLTGRALQTVDYVPQRGDVNAWGDDYANRSDRFLACVAYLDGVHPSAVFCRGYYSRTVLVAWNWDGRALREHWVFDSNLGSQGYSGQGNHNLRVADVDGDGCDEIVYGAMAVDHDGTGLHTTGFGHGDALHMTAFDPQSERLQVWDCHENRRDGSSFRDAATGEVIFQLPADFDVGRCMAADIDPTNPGVEMWSLNSGGIRDLHGRLISTAMPSVNFGIWWDGDLLRELLDRERITKYDWQSGALVTLKRLEGRFNNGTKSNPCLSADILGDWREEVLMRDAESTELRLYVTDQPTPHRINSLMLDVPYRLSVATENVGYNQPPETGIYLGPDTTVRPFLRNR